MRITSVVCCLFITCVLAGKLKWYELDASYTFEAYLEHYGKHYTNSDEYKLRKGIFEANLFKIITHNKDSSKTWKEEINHLADWTLEEMQSLYGYDKQLGFSRKERAVRDTYYANSKLSASLLDSSALPSTVDWRRLGVVSPVKDQGNCGSCWTFATAETIESHWAITSGDLWELSEQQILDCTVNPQNCGGTGGCAGGTVEVATASIIKLGGLSSEWTYPYLSYNGQNQPSCGFSNSSTPPAVSPANYVSLPSNQYEPLINAIATIGPIAISVDASSWSFYATGVYNGCNQTNPDLDHAVQLVGYGTENGADYWLVRNSWSPSWGENGYIKLYREGNNTTCGTDLSPQDGDGCTGGPTSVTVCGTCGILYDSVYPIF